MDGFTECPGQPKIAPKESSECSESAHQKKSRDLLLVFQLPKRVQKRKLLAEQIGQMRTLCAQLCVWRMAYNYLKRHVS